MGNLLPNPLAVHHPRAFRDLKKERPDQADLLVSKHNPGETVIAQKQATGIQNQKNTEQNAHYLLTIFTGEQKRHQASNRRFQKNTEQNAHYLLTIQNQANRQKRGGEKRGDAAQQQTGTFQYIAGYNKELQL